MKFDLNVFCSAFFKRHSPSHVHKSNLLHMSYNYIFTLTLRIYSRSYHILDSPEMIKKKQIQVCECEEMRSDKSL